MGSPEAMAISSTTLSKRRCCGSVVSGDTRTPPSDFATTPPPPPSTTVLYRLASPMTPTTTSVVISIVPGLALIHSPMASARSRSGSAGPERSRSTRRRSPPRSRTAPRRRTARPASATCVALLPVARRSSWLCPATAVVRTSPPAPHASRAIRSPATAPAGTRTCSRRCCSGTSRGCCCTS